jgi:hypothetical protein
MRPHQDRIRQWANVVAALSQFAALFLCFGLGTSFDEATQADVSTPLIEPAGYAFIVWSVIYLGSLAYAAYQFAPARRDDLLLRRIGWPTASAFLSVAVWLVMARFNLIWLTVACIVWMLVSVVPAFVRAARHPNPTPGQRWLVAAPLGVFAGWVTAATFANTAAALKVSGLLDVGLPEAQWTVLFLLAAGVLGAAGTLAVRGRAEYGLTLVWAFVAIAVANLHRGPHPTVALTAGAMAAVVVAALIGSRVRPV